MVELHGVGDQPQRRAAVRGFHLEQQAVGFHLRVVRRLQQRLVGRPLSLQRAEALAPLGERMLREGRRQLRMRRHRVGEQRLDRAEPRVVRQARPGRLKCSNVSRM